MIWENDQSWNKNASVLYLESPAGVGYSIGNLTSDLETNDIKTGNDVRKALYAWFEKFPEYLPNDFFVSGESYGGIYVPYAAWEIHQHNLEAEMNKT